MRDINVTEGEGKGGGVWAYPDNGILLFFEFIRPVPGSEELMGQKTDGETSQIYSAVAYSNCQSNHQLDLIK